MTIQSENSRAVYVADGTTNEFPIPFHFFNNEVAIYRNISDTPLIRGLDYQIENIEGYEGGCVTLFRTPKAGDIITIVRNVELKQLITFLEGENFPAIDFEHALDRLTMGLQQIKEYMTRAVVMPHGSELEGKDIFHCLEMLNKYWEIIVSVPEYIAYLSTYATDTVEENNHNPVTSHGVYDYAYSKSAVNHKLDSVVRKITDTEIIISEATTQEATDVADYPYSYQIAISDVTESNCPVVMFNKTDALSGIFAPFAKAYDGGVTIYLKNNAAYTTTIPLILLL